MSGFRPWIFPFSAQDRLHCLIALCLFVEQFLHLEARVCFWASEKDGDGPTQGVLRFRTVWISSQTRDFSPGRAYSEGRVILVYVCSGINVKNRIVFSKMMVN